MNSTSPVGNLQPVPLGEGLREQVRSFHASNSTSLRTITASVSVAWWKQQFKQIKSTLEYEIAVEHLLRFNYNHSLVIARLPFGGKESVVLYMSPHEFYALVDHGDGGFSHPDLGGRSLAEFIGQLYPSNSFPLLREVIDIAVQRDMIKVKAKEVERVSPGSIAQAAARGERLRKALSPQTTPRATEESDYWPQHDFGYDE